MTPQDFCYWLKGFLEMGDPKDMNEAQMKMLKSHLELVFVNVTSDRDIPEDQQKEILTDSSKDKSLEERLKKYIGIRKSSLGLADRSMCSIGDIRFC